MRASVTMTANRNRFLQSDLVLVVLEIAVPVGVVDLICGGMLAGRLSALTIFRIPFYDWATVVCAVWALLVLNRGPFVAPRTGKAEQRNKTCR
jgi:hypothetical protein